jgi:hypothetical protein
MLCLCRSLTTLSLHSRSLPPKRRTERTEELILFFPSQILPPNPRISLCMSHHRVLHLERFPFSYGALASAEYPGRSKKDTSMTILLYGSTQRCFARPWRGSHGFNPVVAHARPWTRRPERARLGTTAGARGGGAARACSPRGCDWIEPGSPELIVVESAWLRAWRSGPQVQLQHTGCGS